MNFEIGDPIKVKDGVVHTCPDGRKNHRTAKIQSFLEMDGGVKTDRDLRGCRYWNISDIELSVSIEKLSAHYNDKVSFEQITDPEEIENWLKSQTSASWVQGTINGTPWFQLAVYSPATKGEKPLYLVCKDSKVRQILQESQ